jgi:hypothetical protein
MRDASIVKAITSRSWATAHRDLRLRKAARLRTVVNYCCGSMAVLRYKFESNRAVSVGSNTIQDR